MERRMRKNVTFVLHWITSKIFGKQYWSLCNLDKALKFPEDDRTDKNFIVPLKCICKDVKFLWIVKNVLSMFLGGNHRWVPLRLVHENFRFYSYFIAPQEETSIWIFFESYSHVWAPDGSEKVYLRSAEKWLHVIPHFRSFIIANPSLCQT